MTLAQHGISLGRPIPLIPTDDTKTYSVIATLDETRYYLSSLIHQSPKVRNVLVNTFTDGVNHVNDPGKKISMEKSTNRGLSWGSKTTLYDPTDGSFQVGDPSIGYANNGRLHVLADCHSVIGATGGTHELRYFYSDDDGATISTPATISLPVTSLIGFRMYGRLLDLGNNVLIAPCYFSTDEGDATQSERYVIRSTDGGANWTWILVDGPTSAFINEGELLAVTPNILVYICRYDDTNQFYMYKSVDAGLTWSIVGPFGTTVSKSTDDPCRLHKFRADNGKWFCVMYFSDRGNKRIYAIYGRLDNGVDAGVGLFNTSTLTILRTDPSVYIHYGDFCHYNGNMNARGVWPREASAVANEDNELIYFENLTTQYDSVFAVLNPVTIYDKLGLVMGIYDWRGLVSNTTNDWGIVNGSNQVTTLKSIAPGPLNQNFTATAGGIILGDGLEYDGTKALAHGTSSYWDPLSYSSLGHTDINHTIYFVMQFGTSANPNAIYGILGNSGGSSANKGVGAWYDDRAAVPRSNSFRYVIVRGVAGFILDFDNNDVITPNTLLVGCVEIDLSQSSNNDKAKLRINGTLQSTTVTTFNTTPSSPPTFNMQIGGIGNGSILVGKIRQVVIQNTIDLPTVRDNMIAALKGINGIS